MDRALYVGLTGAIQTLRAQTANNNNLANANTTGFRAQLIAAAPVGVNGPGLDSRVNSEVFDVGWDSSPGVIEQTGRDLDIAVPNSNQWLAVQGSDGNESYTRAGNLQVNTLGQLLTASGQPVLSDSGPITLPPYTSVHIANDGTISVVPQGSAPNALTTVARIRVVDAQPDQLQRSADGLLRAKPGVVLNSAAGNTLATGSLETSNVNLASTLVTMLQLSRNFELQSKVLHAADENANQAAGLVRLS